MTAGSQGGTGPQTEITVTDARQVLEAALPEGMEWDEREIVLLGILDRQGKHIQELEAALSSTGYLDTGSRGQVRVNPLVSELRLQYAAMARVAEAIRLPDEVGPVKSIRHQRAAQRRWGRGE